VGASLLAMAAGQVTAWVAGSPLSRAGSLPQLIEVNPGIASTANSPMGTT
jgi:hypothetical protein